MDPQVIVNFTCQRCSQPIHLDQGFSHLSQLTYAELALPIHSGQEADFGPQHLDKVISPFKFNESSGQAHGFTIVEDPAENQKPTPLKGTTKHFDLLSSNSDIDHPMCEECTDAMIKTVNDCIDRMTEELALYEMLLASTKDCSKDETRKLEVELALLQEERDRLLEELSEVKREQIEAEKTLQKCKEERDRLEEEEINYWREYCSYRCKWTAVEDENRSQKSRNTYMQEQNDRLQQMNVLNGTFHIWFSANIGTINGLLLGRLRAKTVYWPEINAAWGQTVLLLSSLARKTNFTFSKYKLIPHGNTSYIEVLGEKKELPLYWAGGFRFIWDHKFDAAMVAFLECLDEFQRYIESEKFQISKGSKKFNLPYRINKHCLVENIKGSGESYSIKMQFNSEDSWTKALKFMLINLKWALTWVSSAKDSTTTSPASSSVVR